MTILIPAVLSTKQCHDYVGGRNCWEELIQAHGDQIKPTRTVPRGDSFWLRESVDFILKLAEETGSLISPRADGISPILKRAGRRFKA